MRFLFFPLLFALSGVLFGQEIQIVSEEESLATMEMGSNSGQVQYKSYINERVSPGSPAVESRGHLVFGFRSGDDRALILDGSEVRKTNYSSPSGYSVVSSSVLLSQQGIITTSSVQYVLDGNQYFRYNYRDKQSSFSWDWNFPAPFGAILYSDSLRSGVAIVFDPSHPSEAFSVIGPNQFSSWLKNQPGGFQLGDDGRLYRNGVVWSVHEAPSFENRHYTFRGRLASGHLLWCDSDIDAPREFLVTEPNGAVNIRLRVTRMLSRTDQYYSYDYGIGPWGEVYALFPPAFVQSGVGKTGGGPGELVPILGPNPAGVAELVVFRNHLKYFGRLNDGGVRLRKDPTTTGEILGAYPAKTGFRILETGTKEENIGGQKNVWYKVRMLDGKEGWFFGAFVHNLYDGPNGKAPPWPNVPDW